MSPFATSNPGVIDRYRARLPLPPGVRVISLHEGSTPLVRLDNLVRQAGLDMELYAKFEGMNPTGSFKDRGMTVAVTHAVAQGSRAVICASTGNTSASAAAYAARAGIAAFVLIPTGKIALGKLAQAIAYGAHVLQIDGDFDAGMALVKALGADLPVTVVNSINPWRIQGQKTAAFEIVDALGSAPDLHCLPVGNAGNISAYWLGYSEDLAAGRISRRPVMLGYQAAGAAPLVRGAPVEKPETLATAIRIGRPQSWDTAIAAQRESKGWFAAVTDDAILAAQRLLATTEGIYCEPASAASLAGLLQDAAANRIPAGSRVVLTLTGHGLKDPEIALRGAPELKVVPATGAAIAAAIRGVLDA